MYYHPYIGDWELSIGDEPNEVRGYIGLECFLLRALNWWSYLTWAGGLHYRHFMYET